MTLFRLQAINCITNEKCEMMFYDFITMFFKGEKQIGIDEDRWFNLNYTQYDGMHLTFTLFKIYFYSYY